MDVTIIALLVVGVFAALLFLGRGQVAKGSNVHVANGAVLLTLAAIAGVLGMAAVLSLDVW